MTEQARNHAQIRYLLLREELMAQLASLINQRKWTQAEAGQRLGVPQSRISDLVRGKAAKFTIDKLLVWLLTLGKTVAIDVSEGPGYATRQGHAPAIAAEVIEYLTRAIALEPDNHVHYQNRGDAHMSLNNFELAIGDYTRSIELHPGSPGGRIQRLSAFNKSGQHRAALKDCDDLIKLFGQGYGSRGLTYEYLGKTDLALLDYDREIALHPDAAGPYWNRGALLDRCGQYEKAIADFEKVCQLNENASFAREAIEAVRKKML